MSTIRKPLGGTVDPEDVARIDAGHLSAVEKLYTLTDRPLVRQFLEDHPQIGPLLLSAAGAISRYFPAAERQLQVIHDPDVEVSGAADMLYVYIATTLAPRTAMEQLDRLEDEWWPTVDLQDQGKLCLNLSFA